MELTHREATTSYRHTQVGVLPIIMWTVVAGLCIALAIRSDLIGLWAVAVLMVVIGLAMSYLTTRVTSQAVQVVFGPGLFRRTIAMTEIVSAEVARSSPLEGWGIRITGEGMLYNITGNQAVRVRLHAGESLRIGTDDPEGLAAAINAGMHTLQGTSPVHSRQ